MDRMDFAQAVARLRVLEKRLLNKSKIERMIDSSSAEEVLKVLQETEYANLMLNVKRAEDYETLLKEELKRVYALMYEISPEKSVVHIMSVKYDYHNIKVLIKGKILERELNDLLIPAGTIELSKLKSSIVTEDYRELTPFMQEAIKEALSIYKEEEDPQKIDIVMDRYMYKEMLFRAEEMNIEFIKDYVKMNIDFINIRTLLRVKTQNKQKNFLKEVIISGGYIKETSYLQLLQESVEGITNKLSSSKYGEILKETMEEYAKQGKMTSFEKVFEDYLMKHIKTAKSVIFGPEPIMGYILAKETEIKVIRIIMVGKLNNVSNSVIRERLRDVYV